MLGIIKCLSWQPLLTSLVCRPLYLQLIASNMKLYGGGWPGRSHLLWWLLQFNTVHWLVQNIRHWAVFRLVSSPDLIWCVYHMGKCTILKAIRAGVEFGSGTKTMTSLTSCPLDTSLLKICLYLAFHDIAAHGKISQIFLLHVCILEAINCWSRLIPRHTCMIAWEWG